MIEHRFLRFALVGAANTALGYGLILLLQYGLGVAPWLANTGGYLAGAALSYALNRRFTFSSRRPHAQAVPRFGAAMGACFLLNLLVLTLCLSVPGMPGALAQALAVGSYTIAFYVISRRLVFHP